MDLLFKRYASPFLLLDEMLLCGRFQEFVTELFNIHNKETENETLWDLYLHSAFLEKSFVEFKKALCIKDSIEETVIDVETTLNETMNDVWNEFNM